MKIEIEILTARFHNVFINDLLFVIDKCRICNFADDNTSYFCGANLVKVLENLQT